VGIWTGIGSEAGTSKDSRTWQEVGGKFQAETARLVLTPVRTLVLSDLDKLSPFSLTPQSEPSKLFHCI